MKTKHHMSINLEGILRNFKGKKITIFQDENGKFVPDFEIRKEIAKLQAKGHKLMSCNPNECEGFDPFGGGCPGHPITEN